MFPTNIDEQETPLVAELGWCPECQSPPSSEYAHVHYCQLHMPCGHGESDRLVDCTSYMLNTEAGGEANRGMCDFLHRKES